MTVTFCLYQGKTFLQAVQGAKSNGLQHLKPVL
jgi:hypothetical protein